MVRAAEAAPTQRAPIRPSVDKSGRPLVPREGAENQRHGSPRLTPGLEVSLATGFAITIDGCGMKLFSAPKVQRQERYAEAAARIAGRGGENVAVIVQGTFVGDRIGATG